MDATVEDNNEWSLPGVDLSETGRYRIGITARDNAGNWARSSETPRVDLDVGLNDTTDPVLAVTSPTDGALLEPSSAVDIAGTWVETESGIDLIQVRVQQLGVSPVQSWGGSAWVAGLMWLDATVGENNEWSLPGVDLSETGRYRIGLTARDNAGNWARSSETPRVDLDVGE